MFIIPKVTCMAWQEHHLDTTPDYKDLAQMAHDFSISVGMLLGIAMPDSWDALPECAKTPLTIFAQRIIEERLGMSEFHDILCENLTAQGYVYGAEDSDEKLTSTVLVPYANLPAHVRIMDACFEASVLWSLRVFWPVHFDLMPAQNDDWVAYQALASGDAGQDN